MLSTSSSTLLASAVTFVTTAHYEPDGHENSGLAPPFPMIGPEHPLHEVQHADVGRADEPSRQPGDDHRHEGVLTPAEEREHDLTS
jgi:hypothetical protein